jgi:hypothetical protein
VSSPSAIPADPLDHAAGFSAGEIITSTYRFAAGRWSSVLAAIGVPVGLGALVLLILFKTYFSLLAYYLKAPDARLASLTVSAVAAIFFVWLLLNVVASARLARLVQGEVMRNLFAVRGMALEARLYAAVLRYFFLVFGSFALTAWILGRASHVLLPQVERDAVALSGLVLVVFSMILFVRCGLLLPALAVYERRRILRRGWSLSRGRFWRMAAIGAVVVVAPVVVIQTAGEILSQQFVHPIVADGAGGLFRAADMLATDAWALIAIVLTLSLSTAAGLTLATIGSCLIYRRLAGHS